MLVDRQGAGKKWLYTKTPTRPFRIAGVLLAIVSLTGSPQKLLGAERKPERSEHFLISIDRMPLSGALAELSRQTGVSILYDADAVGGALSEAVQGILTIELALGGLLENTCFEFTSTGPNSIAIAPLRGCRLAGRPADSPANTRDTRHRFAPREPEEIVVTALRRPAPMQDVPASVSTITASEIEAAGVTGFFDYAQKVPGLSFGYTGDGRFDARGTAIRGVSGRATTGFYVDEIQIPETMEPRIFDIDRIEVLRGPQGTLYGSQSMGGAIRIISRPPTDSTVAGLRASAASVFEGDWDQSIDAVIGGALTPTLAMSASGFVEYRSGTFDRLVEAPGRAAGSIVNHNVDDDNSFGTRLSARWRLRDNLTITPTIWHQHTSADGSPFADIDADNFDQVRFFDINESGEDSWTMGSLVLKSDGGSGELTVATSFVARDVIDTEDISEIVFDLFDLSDPVPATLRDDTGYRKLAQEIRFVSGSGLPLTTIAGAYAARERTVGEIPETLIVGVDRTDPGVARNIASLKDTSELTEFALYAELGWQIYDRLSTSFGVRWFETDLENSRRQDGVLFDDVVGRFENRRTDTGWQPRFSLQYRSDDSLVYASASSGYRAGGTNPPIPGVGCAGDLESLQLDADAIRTYSSDSLVSYELGYKKSASTRPGYFNAAVFHIEWDDVQQVVFPACGFPFRTNSGSAEIRGAEVEILANVGGYLDLRAAAAYLDDEIRRPLATGGNAVFELDQVPDWTASLSATLHHRWPGRWTAALLLDSRYVGDSISLNNDSAEPRLREPYSVLDLRYAIENASWRVALFAENLTNTRANLADNRSIALELSGRPRIVTNRPRRIGLEVSYLFD